MNTTLPLLSANKNNIKKVFDLTKSPIANKIIPVKDLYIKCPICMDFTLKVFRPDVCSHWFCETCIQIWTKYKKECPYCRRSFNHLISK